MFNSKRKKESIDDLKRTAEKYNKAIESTKKMAEELFNCKLTAKNEINEISKYLSRLARKPKSFDLAIEEIKSNIKEFDYEIDKIERSSVEAGIKSGTILGTGVAAGTATVALAPTALMAIATTFGTASTGAAISGLSGAAASSAALAWLGGGALAAGGGGMAAGETILALTGPVGWAIGGLAALGGGLYFNGKNKKIAEEAEYKDRKIRREKNKLDKIISLGNTKKNEVEETNKILERYYCELLYNKVYDYKIATEAEKKLLQILINIARTLSAMINEKLVLEE